MQFGTELFRYQFLVRNSMFHADGVSMLQPQPSGTRFHHSSAHHPLVVDSLELGWKPISSHRPVDTSENLRWRAYYFTFTWYGFSAPTSSMCVIDVVNCWLSGATCCRQFVSICFRASVSLCNYSIFFQYYRQWPVCCMGARRRSWGECPLQRVPHTESLRSPNLQSILRMRPLIT